MNIEAYNLDSLRKIVRKLFTENRRLKQQLKSANISFESEDLFSEQVEKGKFNDMVNSYGMVIIDECHHAAATTSISVLEKVNARYVYRTKSL